MSRSLFLSHSGVDTEAAAALKARVLAAPAAREHGLSVWFDKDDLRAGEPWQSQLEEAIGKSHAFAVYVGSKGVVNWVEAEVRLALNRAITEPDCRFIPVLAPQAPGLEALPGFVALYQSVADVEGRPDQFAKLLAAVLGQDAAGTAKLEAEPFFGLKAVDEDRAHLFFGREEETEALLQLLRREPLVMVTGDSGSGKSSLARAGLVPRWRGSALAEAMGERPGDTIWHVVQAQPRTRPFQALAEAVGEAAKRLGVSLADRGTLEGWARSGDPDQVRRALWCDLPPDRTRVLLLVDQFEELVTIAEPAERALFVRLLLALADPNDPRARVVLTMRRDYYNLLSAFPELYDRLEAEGHRARLILGRIAPEGLRRIVTEPLRLAGVPEGDRTALAGQVAAEMGYRPGDLALVQMALTEAWDRRHQFEDDLLRAYAAVGRIEGAIARAAEDVYEHVLDEDERALAEPVFVRLVRLGDTGGATRRLATRAEFDDARWRLVQKLASKEAKRLVLVGGSDAAETAEIAHEALVTQWPRYQTWLSGRDPDGADRAADKRVLDALTHRAVAWEAAPDAHAKAKRLATGADLDAFVGLAGRRPAWLSAGEHKLVRDSHEAAIRQQRRERWLFRGAVAAAVVAIVAAGGAWQQRNHAIAEAQRAEHRQFIAESQQQTISLLPREGARLGLRALELGTTQEERQMAEAVLLQALFAIRFNALEGHSAGINAIALSPNGKSVVTASSDACAIIWNLAGGQKVRALKGHRGPIHDVNFSSSGERIVTASKDGTARIWSATTGEQVTTARDTGELLKVSFSPDGATFVAGSKEGTISVWDAETGDLVRSMAGHSGRITALAFDPRGEKIVTASEDGTAKVWHSDTGAMLTELKHKEPLTQQEFEIASAEFSSDGKLIATASHDGKVRVWNAENGELMATLDRHSGIVEDAEFSPDGGRVVSAGRDGTSVVWAWQSDEVLTTFSGHQGHVYSVRFASDGRRVASAADDGSAIVWDASTGALEETLSGHLGAVWGATFTPDGDAVLTYSSDGTARVWRRWVTSLAGHKGAVYTVNLSPEKARIATASADGSVRLWHADDGAFVRSLEDPGAGAGRKVFQAVFAPDGRRLVTAATDGDIQVWDTANGRLLQENERPGAPATDALFGPSGAPLVGVYADGLVRWWPEGDLDGEVQDVGQHDKPVHELQFSPDGVLFLTISWDGTAILWDSATGRERHRLQGHEGGITSAAFSPDAQQVVTVSIDGTARVWSTESGDLLEVLRLHQGPLAKVAFSFSGNKLATASWDSTARIWDADTFQPLVRLGGHRGRVHGVAFFDDGRIVATTSWDGATRIWHVATGLQVATLEGHRGIVYAMTIGPDGSRLITASEDGTARIWALPYVDGMDIEAAARDLLAGQSADEPACPARE